MQPLKSFPSYLDETLEKLNRKQVLLTGIEAHVCVFQTAMDLGANGFDVHVVSDAVTSRRLENKQVALDRLRQSGATVTSTEMALFELVKVASGDRFKAILELVR